MKTEIITLRVEENVKDALVAICEKRDIPMSQLIRHIVKDYLNRENQEN